MITYLFFIKIIGKEIEGQDTHSEHDFFLDLTWGAGLPDFSWHNIPKLWKMYQIATKLPNYHKINEMAVIYSKWRQNVPNIFYSKVLQNLPKLGVLF
jgi:hypothetical protein